MPKRRKDKRRRPPVPGVAEREANGRVKREPTGPACTPEALDQRRKLMPSLDDKMLTTARAGVPLEMLFDRGSITKAQRDAGHRYRVVVDRWRAVKGVRDGTRQPRPGTGSELDPVVVDRVTREYIAAHRVVENLTPIARAALETVCIDEAPSRIMAHDALGERLREALRTALSALRDFFKIREDEDKAA